MPRSSGSPMPKRGFISFDRTVQRVRAKECARCTPRLVAFPPRTTRRMCASPTMHELLEKLKSRLLELQLKRTELAHPLRAKLPSCAGGGDARLARRCGAIEREEHAPVRDETTEKDPTTNGPRQSSKKRRSTCAACRRVPAPPRANCSIPESRRGSSAKHPSSRRTCSGPPRVAEESYLLYVRKREEARIGDALDAHGFSISLSRNPLPSLRFPSDPISASG